MSSSTSRTLVARSKDGSLVGIHRDDAQSSSSASSASSTTKTGYIRCYDGDVSNGSLKFTLRFPLLPPSSPSSSVGGGGEVSGRNVLQKLTFASRSNDDDDSPGHLCGMVRPPPSTSSSTSSSSSSILIWDLDRGVLTQTIDVRSSSSSSSGQTPKKKKQKKKKRKSSSSSTSGEGSDGNEILCDMATRGSYLYALVFLPDDDDTNGDASDGGGKCRIYQYDLSGGGEASLVKKIKVGSSSSFSNGTATFAIAAASSSESNIVVVRMNSQLRVLNAATGERIGKFDYLALNAANNNNNSGGMDDEAAASSSSSPPPLTASADGRYIVSTAGISNNRAIVVSCQEKNVKLLSLLDVKDASSSITQLDLLSSSSQEGEGEGGLTIMAFQSTAGVASLFHINDNKSLEEDAMNMNVPQTPKAQLRTSDGGDSNLTFVSAAFRSSNDGDEEDSLQLLFQHAKKHHRGGSAAGSGTTLPMESVSYDNDMEGTVIVGASLSSSASSKEEDSSKKRKKKKSAESLALAPGDQGRDAALAADLSAGMSTKKKKKAKVMMEEGDNDDDDGDLLNMEEEEGDGEGGGQSIAERLALLSSAMEQQTDEEEEDDDDDDNDDGSDDDDVNNKGTTASSSSQLRVKGATSQTLTTLLTQALSSGDAVRLNVALQVTDRRLVEDTVRSLQSLDAQRGSGSSSTTTTNDNDNGGGEGGTSSKEGYASSLLAHIVRRMARRHSLVMPLGVWVRAILASTAHSSGRRVLHSQIHNNHNNTEDANDDDDAEERMAREAREMALKLGPLKNFLNERVEAFPALLRLEGRLALLNQQL